MNKTEIKNVITKNAQVIKSLEWATKLLKELDDTENLESILKIQKEYNSMTFEIMRQNNINKIVVEPTRNSKVTYTINQPKG